MTLKNTFGLLCRIVVGGILIYAGFVKAAGQQAEFAGVIAAYKILPASFVTPLSLALPYIEMWVGLFVLCGYYTRYASLAAALLFCIFLGVLGSALARGIDLTACGCFGADSLSPRHTLAMDILLLGLALAGQKLNRSSPPWSFDRALS